VEGKELRLMWSSTNLDMNANMFAICDKTSVFLLFSETGSLMHRNFDINKN